LSDPARFRIHSRRELWKSETVIRRIDLNCDLGEGGAHDAELMPLITSANIACGAHAGGPDVMRKTVELAKAAGVSVGAHPGFADRENFGRRELGVSPEEIRRLVAEQISSLQKIAADLGRRVRHVKPHGALYNLAARDPRIADAITDAVWAAGKELLLYGLAGSELIRSGKARGLRVLSEVFADRAYANDGSLVPRTEPHAVLRGERAMVEQALSMATRGVVSSFQGRGIPVLAETICLHGDGPHPVEFAKRLRGALQEAGVVVRPPDDL
jgi:UPF0271 protein